MITIARCYDIEEARRFQIALWSADIPSFIPDEATAQNAPYFFIGSGPGVRLQVAEEHEAEAREVISNIREVPTEEESSQVCEPRKDQDEGEERF